ncbi:DUF4174 domain-containing protein [Paracoccus sediminicola]|uniref:DUF4174 domain-containing protein n=1 Tax=Paracoccus sediminicola TaxID=3017783 RepID=UPI0022F02E8B|nr:DUF4174 domain-containing protein [Paracoccus sediminicola]WBU57942.1 DUF4174 domain-containing protein [Paracoccus sediminicola]
MRHILAITIGAFVVAAMGDGGDSAPPSRINPPSPAEVDAAQASGGPTRPEVEPRTLRILDAAEVAPEDFLWTARPVVVFSDTAADPAYTTQIDALRDRPEPMIERDVVIVTDTDPGASSLWRKRLNPRGFSLIIMDKDGQVKQRKPSPWSVRAISRAIDKFPLRREEIGRVGLKP